MSMADLFYPSISLRTSSRFQLAIEDLLLITGNRDDEKQHFSGLTRMERMGEHPPYPWRKNTRTTDDTRTDWLRYKMEISPSVVIDRNDTKSTELGLKISVKKEKVEWTWGNQTLFEIIYVNELIAMEIFMCRAVMEAPSSHLPNTYSEGRPGARYYCGDQCKDKMETTCQRTLRYSCGDQCKDQMEMICCQRPLAGFSLNSENWGDRIMGLDTPSGGNICHVYHTPNGRKIWEASIFLDSFPYKVDRLDCHKHEEKALDFRPKILICGGSSYPRELVYASFESFRQIADKYRAVLMRDMAHIGGLVAAKSSKISFLTGNDSKAYGFTTSEGQHVLGVRNCGKTDNKELYQNPFVDDEKFLQWRIQFLERSIRKLDFSPIDVFINVLKNLAGAFKRGLCLATNQALQLLQDNYPEFVAKQVFIDCPWWYLAFNRMISPFLTLRTQSKFGFEGHPKSAETLFKCIASGQVPVQFGGLSREDDQEFTTADCVTMDTIRPASEYTVEIPVSQHSKNLMISRYDPKTGRFVYVNAKTSGDMLTPDSQHVLPNCGNEDVEIEKMLRQAGALRARELFIHDAVHHCREGSHKPSQNVTTGQREFLCWVLLLMAALVAKITYQAAFGFSVGTLKQGYAFNYAANGILQLKKRDGIANRSFILFNSSGFVVSVTVIISLLHEFPLKPWPQISVSTLFGSYMCLIMATSPREAFALLFLAIPFITLATAGKLHGFARERSY